MDAPVMRLSASDGLGVELRARDCRRVFIGGLPTGYCVRATALDALSAGFETVILADAVRAVETQPGDGQRVIEEVLRRGVQLGMTGSLVASRTPI
jgi:nicotinamidase/pyrazinamidase